MKTSNYWLIEMILMINTTCNKYVLKDSYSYASDYPYSDYKMTFDNRNQSFFLKSDMVMC